MKKLLISLVVCLTILSASSVAIQASAQGMSLADMVNLFIGLGIIPADKADAARAAIGIAVPPIATSTQISTRVKITDSKIKLDYDSARKESLLTTTFKGTLTTGTAPITIANFARVYFENNNAPGVYSNTGVNSAKSEFRILSSSAGVTNTSSSKEITIPSNGHINFEATVTADPKQMFAGVYKGIFNGLYHVGKQGYFGDPVSTNKSVTVIG